MPNSSASSKSSSVRCSIRRTVRKTAWRLRANSRHVPFRQCVACRTRAPQARLVRFVRTAGGWSVDSARVRAAGRGAYLCSRPCAERVRKHKRYAGLAV
ncbi:MAG: DUF448 domain-containing protein, partial [Candidatus Eremiobacteraeota bacterium]|nr:DUF448 domain-containing protein [Candidatus Eremiobacteraeota bacterium]